MQYNYYVTATSILLKLAVPQAIWQLDSSDFLSSLTPERTMHLTFK